MIRVNLLPQKRRKPAAARGDMWLVASLVLVALEVVACFVWYGSKQDELAQQHGQRALRGIADGVVTFGGHDNRGRMQHQHELALAAHCVGRQDQVTVASLAS